MGKKAKITRALWRTDANVAVGKVGDVDISFFPKGRYYYLGGLSHLTVKGPEDIKDQLSHAAFPVKISKSTAAKLWDQLSRLHMHLYAVVDDLDADDCHGDGCEPTPSVLYCKQTPFRWLLYKEEGSTTKAYTSLGSLIEVLEWAQRNSCDIVFRSEHISVELIVDC